MGMRRKGRELALQALYQLDLSGDEPGAGLRVFWEHCDAPSDARAFGEDLVGGAHVSYSSLSFARSFMPRERRW